MTDFAALWEQALPYDAFLAAGDLKHRGLWEGLHRLARIPDWALAADWCGDASNTVPVLARLADLSPGVELRILRRDEHPELMDRYLTNGSRSIPISSARDRDSRELGHWGPRPAALQSWVLAERARGTPKEEIYPSVRKWYARDHGETTLREVLQAAKLAA